MTTSKKICQDGETQNPPAPGQTQKLPSRATELYPLVPWKYDATIHVMSLLVDLFFREVHPRGSWKVPRSGPILFVAAPHANQVGLKERFLILSHCKLTFCVLMPSYIE